MNGLTGGNRGPRRAGAQAVAPATALLATGCGLVHVHVGSSGGPAPMATADIRQDLARFDSMFGLPAARLQIVNTLVHAKSPWLASVGEVRDTEVVHALAPGAVIREVLIPSTYAVADVALPMRQDTRRRDRGTGQLEAGS